MKLLNTASIVAGILSGLWNMPIPASAADFYNKTPAAVAPIYAPVPYSWTAAYVGGTFGYGFGDFTESGVGTSGDLTASGVKGGGFFGVRHQFTGTQIVLGAEGDLMATNETASFPVATGSSCTRKGCVTLFTPASLQADWVGDASVQLGYALGPDGRVLPYIEGGPSYGSAGFGLGPVSAHIGGWGYHVGVGVDYVPAMWGDHIGFGALYRFTHINGPDASAFGQSITTAFEDNSILGRVFYRFPQ
jgi:outer membrane immunogenic protein